MKIACTGSTGRVGRLLVKRGVVPLSFDVTDYTAARNGISSLLPDVVIHLAGISNVDYCEAPEHWDEVRRVNFRGTANVVRVCDDLHIPVAYISSEHVFASRRWWQAPRKEHDAVSRVGVSNYALVKIACEGLRYAFPSMKIIRTSHLFDWVRLMTEEFKYPGNYAFPTFIHRSYMYLPHFASNLLLYANRIEEMPTILHLAGSKIVSEYQFMQEFVEYFHIQGTHVYKRTKPWPVGEALPIFASRPHRAGLDIRLSVDLGFPAYSYRDGFEQMEKDVHRG